ncbi:RNA polymerase sigma-70 factor, sigma-E family [Nonomuraea solani]|uniref:RNA polymerase sigma-70 factor, sigma-E family n=1 Tax=Nonomuraea solani TaxID=1144553 RepID=A0A1H6CV51_9ACTN|nr:SigE family RNA polymerase sigma factor [Nonomuraea solani]SEG76573.1 RNA polymerase sigma-70 factor, sigma-E family [Nonomuraea solani]
MDRNVSFQAFADAHQHRLLRLAYLLTGDVHLGEDLLQSVLVRMYGRWPKLRHVDRPEAYARRTMVNQYISWRRRRGANEVSIADPPERACSPEDSPEDSTVLRLVLHQALMRLTPKQRAVLVLRFYEDRTERDVADLLGCSVGTVKSQTHHALARLRALAPELAPNLPTLDEAVEDPDDVAR